MSGIQHIGKGRRGPNTLSFFYCYGICHFWRAGAYIGCRCLCGKMDYKDAENKNAHHIIFAMEERRPHAWSKKAEDEHLRKNGYVKRSEYEKTFIFDPITGTQIVA